jgi:hypothetical protein
MCMFSMIIFLNPLWVTLACKLICKVFCSTNEKQGNVWVIWQQL